MFISDLVSRNFPEDLGRLSSLKELMANGNRLQYLPDSFGSFVKAWIYAFPCKLIGMNMYELLSFECAA
jgi:hypothetical protein